MFLPGNDELEGGGSDDLQGGEHNQGGEISSGGLSRRAAEGISDGREDVADPDGDAVRGFGVREQAGAVASRVGEEEMHEVCVSDSHCIGS